MDIKSIARTAAVIYADSMSNVTTKTIKRRFIEAIFVNNGNKQLTIAELANQIESEMNLQFSEDEIRPIVKDDRIFVEVLSKSSEDIKYNLQEKRFVNLSSKPIDEIDKVIDSYLKLKGDSVLIEKDDFRELIYRFLHAILNSNIAAYSHIVNPKKVSDIPKLKDLDRIEEDEIDYINDFIKWDNEDKNKAIFKLINYCIEYAVVVNDSSENVLSESLRTKIFYLDNSLIYRALGINGQTRKKRALSFLKKCKESGQKFMISKITRQEFFDTVNYHLDQLNSSTPFGRISPRVFKRYANGDGFYQFYHEWRNGLVNYGFDIFKTHIHMLYKDLIKQFEIEEDYNVPFDEREEPQIINKYADEIQSIKKTNKFESHLMDAKNMYWIECKRDGNNYDVSSTKYYFITADQKLQAWDNNHSIDQPITLLPSQWMGLILKYVSRSSDDYKSFISFMNLPKDNSVISEDEMQVVMAGISSMTEDFTKQESYIESMVEMKFADVLKGDIRENAKAFAKDKLEEELEKRLEEKEKEKTAQAKLDAEKMLSIKREAKQELERREKAINKERYDTFEKTINSLNKRRTAIMNKVEKRKKLLKTILCCFESVLIIGWGILILKLGWDKMEKWTYVIGLPLLLFSNISFAIYGESINVFKFIDKICDNYKRRLYVEYDFSENELKELERMKQEIQD